MAFSTSYRTMLDRNIRHVYSDVKPELHVPRVNIIHYLDPAKRFHEDQLKPYDKFTTRSMVYVPEYDIQLPRAPAFREMGAVEIKRLVARLSRPIQCQMKDYICHKETNRQMKYMCGDCELNLIPNTVSKKKLDEINERLQRPTTSCSNRIRMRPLHRFDIFEINDSCRKAGTRPNSLLPRRESSDHRPRPLTAL